MVLRRVSFRGFYRWGWAAALGLSACAAPVFAQSPTLFLSGLMGDKALVVVAGVPVVVRAGSVLAGGARVLEVSAQSVDIELAGRRQRLGLQGGAVQVGRTSLPSAGGTGPVALTAGRNGLFSLDAQIQGTSVPGVVDTGASLVAIPLRLAGALGLDANAGPVIQMSTANGRTQGHRVVIPVIRVAGQDVRNVDAVVVSGDLPTVLWGHSLLKSFQIQVQGGRMMLTSVAAAPTTALAGVSPGP